MMSWFDSFCRNMQHSNSARSPPVLYVSTGSLWKGILLGGFFYWRSVLSDYTWHVVNGKKVFLVLRQKKGKRHQHTKWYNLWPWFDEIPKAFSQRLRRSVRIGNPFRNYMTILLCTSNLKNNGGFGPCISANLATYEAWVPISMCSKNPVLYYNIHLTSISKGGLKE